MTGASKRGRRPTVYRGVELRYGNMGSGSDGRRDVLRRLGRTSIHRRSFHGTHAWLFS
jgi:hypothetical protein